jgi:hypothetical protein
LLASPQQPRDNFSKTVTYALILVAILLTLVAAALLVFMPRNAWPSHRKGFARAVVILLFATEGAGLAGLGQLALSAGTVAVIIAAASIVTLILAQFTAGLFRWITSLAAIALILWWIPILAILTAGPGFR